MQIAETRFSMLIDRLDANFYVSRLSAVDELRSTYTNLGEVCRFPRARTPARHMYFNTGIPVIKLKNITRHFLNLRDTDFIPRENYNEFFQPRKDDILLTATGEGTIGRVGIFRHEIKCVVTAEVIVARTERINPCFVFAYLRSHFGRSQLVRYARGSTGQTHLYAKDVALLPVPTVGDEVQKEIQGLVEDAHCAKEQADATYQRAEEVLMHELNLGDLGTTKNQYFKTMFSEIVVNKRIDAEYYMPRYRSIMQRVHENEKKGIYQLYRLQDLCSLRKGIEVGSQAYVSSGILFLRVSNISAFGIMEGESSKYITHHLYECLKEKYQARTNEVLYTKDATVGVALVVDEHLPKSIPSMGVVRLQPNGVDPYYLALVLNSIICSSQSQRETIGAVIKHYNVSKLKNLEIPVISMAKQKTIADLIKNSFVLKNRAESMLDSATERVETIFIKKSR